jgi:isopentenyl-diphosphate delta-isomerase
VAKTALAAGEELVVLVDEGGKEIGTAAKVHHEATPLHRAFSCYLVDGDGRVC